MPYSPETQVPTNLVLQAIAYLDQYNDSESRMLKQHFRHYLDLNQQQYEQDQAVLKARAGE